MIAYASCRVSLPMITVDYVRLMAAYNSHMNRALYAAADRLGEAGRRQPRGAFWSSIHGTLSHLAWGDQMWMSRFDGWEKPDVPLAQSSDFVPDWAALAARRPAMDARLEAWAAALAPGWLAADEHWYSGAAQRDMSAPRGKLVMHFFNHQTHHRGQVHAMLTAAGERTGDTDLMLVV